MNLPNSGEINFTHLNDRGAAHMVDVTEKKTSARSATAVGRVKCSPAIIDALRNGTVPKGDVLAVARIAGIQAAKRTPQLLPLAHVIGIHGANVELTLDDEYVTIEAVVKTVDRTGVEMEALTCVVVAALAIIDMVKGVDRGAEIVDCKIIHKEGGRSGDWWRPGCRPSDAEK